MDFITTAAPPVRIKVDGAEYAVPRFLRPDFAVYVADRRQKAMDEALALLPDADARARFRLYHHSPPQDVMAIAQELTTPEGIEVVIRTCFAKVNMPPASIEGFLTNVDTELQRSLVDQLRSGNGMIAGMQAASGDPGAAGNPPTGQPHTSAGSPTISATTPQMSPDSSPDATPTA